MLLNVEVNKVKIFRLHNLDEVIFELSEKSVTPKYMKVSIVGGCAEKWLEELGFMDFELIVVHSQH